MPRWRDLNQGVDTPDPAEPCIQQQQSRRCTTALDAEPEVEDDEEVLDGDIDENENDDDDEEVIDDHDDVDVVEDSSPEAIDDVLDDVLPHGVVDVYDDLSEDGVIDEDDEVVPYAVASDPAHLPADAIARRIPVGSDGQQQSRRPDAAACEDPPRGQVHMPIRNAEAHCKHRDYGSFLNRRDEARAHDHAGFASSPGAPQPLRRCQTDPVAATRAYGKQQVHDESRVSRQPDARGHSALPKQTLMEKAMACKESRTTRVDAAPSPADPRIIRRSEADGNVMQSKPRTMRRSGVDGPAVRAMAVERGTPSPDIFVAPKALGTPYQEEGHLVAGKSSGLWLDRSDFIVGYASGFGFRSLDSPLDLGVHIFPRDWQRNYKTSSAVKILLKKSGPCGGAKKVKTVSSPGKEYREFVKTQPLMRLHSFENAKLVASVTDFSIVKGWAIYDVSCADPGKAYIAERYWWNADKDDVWLDFTPRAEGRPDMVLVQPVEEEPPRTLKPVTEEQLVLYQGLEYLRYHDASATVCFNSVGMSAFPLRSRDVNAKGEARDCAPRCPAPDLRHSMLAVPALCGGLAGQLSYEMTVPIVLLLAVLCRCLQVEGLEEAVVDSFINAKAVEALMHLLTSKTLEIAAMSAAALACLCQRRGSVKRLIFESGGVNAFALLFDRDGMRDARHESIKSIAHAVRCLWLTPSLEDDPILSDRDRLPTVNRGHWDQLKETCMDLQAPKHMLEPPRVRRANSWARTLDFARVSLGTRGVALREGSREDPMVIWVLNAKEMVEVHLACEGHFADANWSDKMPMEIVFVGDDLQERSSQDGSQVGGFECMGEPSSLTWRTANPKELPWMCRFTRAPDLAVVFMPEFPEAGQQDSGVVLPDAVLAAVAKVPTIITTRQGLSESNDMAFRCRLQGSIVMKRERSPFSSSGLSRSNSSYDDNAWAFAVSGPGALAKTLQMDVLAQVLPTQAPTKIPALFWGILDIKYDTSKPILDRVKVLETGDGRTSKFSGDGQEILRRFKEKYFLDQDVDFQAAHQVIACDKRLTHNIMSRARYGHIVPDQACFPRIYDSGLARKIIEELGLEDATEEDDEHIVLKLCNRSRAAGVLVTRLEDLDDLLRKILNPPESPDNWFDEKCKRLTEQTPLDLGFTRGSLEEHYRHWWCNDSPVFVAERCCRSVPVSQNNLTYDGTLRIGFVLKRQRAQKPWEEVSSAENLEVDWLGGYWKLPKSDMGAASLRDCVISAARTAGTAPVKNSHLAEIYAALGDSVQNLFSPVEPSDIEDLCSEDAPEFGAYVMARLSARPSMCTPQSQGKAQSMAAKLDDPWSKRIVEAFLRRTDAVMELRANSVERWSRSEEHLRQSYQLSPWNANTWYLLGTVLLQTGSSAHLSQLLDAKMYLNRSLLLDPDLKAGYVNLAVAYLRLSSYSAAAEVCQAGIDRHPDTIQLHYNSGVANCMLARELLKNTMCDQDEVGILCQKSLNGFNRAQVSDEAKRQRRARVDNCSPDQPNNELDSIMRESMEKRTLCEVELPPLVGQTVLNYRL